MQDRIGTMNNFYLLHKIVTIPFLLLIWGIFFIGLGAAFHTTCLGFESYIIPLVITLGLSLISSYLLRNDIFSLQNNIQAFEAKKFSYITDSLLINVVIISIITTFLFFFTSFLQEDLFISSFKYVLIEFIFRIYKFYILLPISSFFIYLVSKKKIVQRDFVKTLSFTSDLLLIVTALSFWITTTILYLPIFSFGDCEV